MSEHLQLSAVDVCEIQDLEKARQNGLPAIAPNKTYLFYFQVSCNGHYGAAELRCTPFFEPALRLKTCCAQAMLKHLIAECQKVYTMCVTRVELVFASDKYEDVYGTVNLANCTQ